MIYHNGKTIQYIRFQWPKSVMQRIFFQWPKSEKYIRVTTRDNTSTTRVRHDTTQVKHETIRYNTSTTQPNTGTKEARAAKIRLYIALFVTELYFFLILFRNSYYSPTSNIVSTL